MRRLPNILPLILLVVAPMIGMGVGANQSEVRNRIKQAQADIARIDRLLGETRKEQGTTLGHLKLVESKIESRKKIIEGVESEMQRVTAAVSSKNQDVSRLQKTYRKLKQDYTSLLRIAYKNYRNNSYLAFVVSAQDFSDAARRVYYVKQIGRNTERKADELEAMNRRLNGEIQLLDQQQRLLADLQLEHRTEMAQLQKEEGQLKENQAQLKGKEASLLAQAETRRKQMAELERELQRLIAEEVKRSNAAAKKAGKSTASDPLTARFEAKRGNLLRPVDGVVIDRYGLHDHPTQRGVKINNKGVNLAARAGDEVSAVFDGEVRKVFFFQGLGNSVMVRHGSYLTIYSNLGELLVREGEQVLEGQRLGSVAAVAGGQATLHFELWRESENLDPEKWIAR